MKILEVPKEFRVVRSHYGENDHNWGVAEAFHHEVVERGLKPNTHRTYVPIFWSSNYHNYCQARKDPVFRPNPAVQEFLNNNIDPDELYFTVSRCDDGLYEELPHNVLVFGACSRATINIPLATDLEYTGTENEKDILASFCGQSTCGGPDTSLLIPRHSVWNAEGVGSLVRRRMLAVFKDVEDCALIDEKNGGSRRAWATMIDLISRSKFALCPRGYAPTSFRLYEAISFGAVPVYISDKFILPYQSQVDWNEFCIFCKPEQLTGLPERLRNVSESWRINAVKKLRELYSTHFSLKGTCQQIANILNAGVLS